MGKNQRELIKTFKANFSGQNNNVKSHCNFLAQFPLNLDSCFAAIFDNLCFLKRNIKSQYRKLSISKKTVETIKRCYHLEEFQFSQAKFLPQSKNDRLTLFPLILHFNQCLK